ncbi:hypothetical protein FQN57_003768 [Myotisia sp. PD_48]|nr:hypothetical protein FQN57_003768 [Myotisia sp. PD_48]
MTELEWTDPLLEALPPATDYLTYLTLVEYQLTPARLPTLHHVLQDETLTTNIGWDLVQLLLPMLPASRECLDDIARLGNPREVILRVSDSLMKLRATDTDDDDDDDDDDKNDDNYGDDDDEEENKENKENELNEERGPADTDGTCFSCKSHRKPPLHIQQFYSLLSMLSVLHGRIKTKYPSRFVATSLQAVLEAYTEYPTPETTAAVLDFLRSLSGEKRPLLPPRSSTGQLPTRSTRTTAAPDPEADAHEDADCNSLERALIKRLLQFGLIETLKTYLLQCIDEPAPAGMQWAVRLQEKFKSRQIDDMKPICIEEYDNVEHLRDRDATVGKVVALSRDFGLCSEELLRIIFTSENDQPPPLDFDHIPKSPEAIPLERHGCVLLLAARCVTTALFGSSTEPEAVIHLYPDIANILLNFLGNYESPYTAAEAEPISLIDSILSLAAIARISNIRKESIDDVGFKTLIHGLTACARGPPRLRAFCRNESIPSKAYHAYPDAQGRLDIILEIFNDDELQYARISAIQWLKEEVMNSISASTSRSNSDHESSGTIQQQQQQHNDPFTNDPEKFANLCSAIFKYTPPEPTVEEGGAGSSSTSTSPTVGRIDSRMWMEFIQDRAPLYEAKLNFYYFLLTCNNKRSSKFGAKVGLSALHPSIRTRFLEPLKRHVLELAENKEVTSRIAQDLGDVGLQMGTIRVGLVLGVIEDIEQLAHTKY